MSIVHYVGDNKDVAEDVLDSQQDSQDKLQTNGSSGLTASRPPMLTIPAENNVRILCKAVQHAVVAQSSVHRCASSRHG